jgi:DegV family protein with EDD domain
MINLAGKTYRSGVDITYKEFYTILEETGQLPTTSLPSPGEFAELYSQLAEKDPEILSVHISSGLSGTSNSARDGAAQAPQANVTIHDTMTLSIGEGWQVEAAVRAAQAGWNAAQTVPVLERVREITETVFTLPELKYLIHGGRISHIKGLLAQILNIKPIIGVGKADGKYFQRDQQRTFNKAMAGIVNLIAKDVPRGAPLRIQVAHANYPEGADTLQEMIEKVFPCEKLPISDIAPVLGAHTGPGLVGLAYAPLDKFPTIA